MGFYFWVQIRLGFYFWVQIRLGFYFWVQIRLGFYFWVQIRLGFFLSSNPFVILFLSSNPFGILFFEFKSVWDFIFEFKSVWDFIFEVQIRLGFYFWVQIRLGFYFWGASPFWILFLNSNPFWIFLSLNLFGILSLSSNPFWILFSEVKSIFDFIFEFKSFLNCNFWNRIHFGFLFSEFNCILGLIFEFKSCCVAISTFWTFWIGLSTLFTYNTPGLPNEGLDPRMEFGALKKNKTQNEIELRDKNQGLWNSTMDVSENSGTPKSSILIGFSIINHPFWGAPIFGNTHIYIYIWKECRNRSWWMMNGSKRAPISMAIAPLTNLTKMSAGKPGATWQLHKFGGLEVYKH